MKIDHPQQFKEGVRILIRLTRTKDGAVGNVDRHAKKVITRNAEEFDKAMAELESGMVEGERIYSTVEERNPEKAIRIFKERQLAADYDRQKEAFYFDIKNRWVSSLQNPSASLKTLFLFDCDDAEASLSVIKSLKETGLNKEVIHHYRTKNGVHIITNPFNYTVLPQEVQKLIHKNALILWAY